MTSIKWAAALLSSAFLFASCASTKRNVRYPVYVTNKCVIDLLPDEDCKSNVDALYSVMIKEGGDTFNTLAYLTIEDTGVYITMLNDFGVSMGSISYGQGELAMNAPMLPKMLKAQYIIADVQFAFYDEEAVRKALEYAGLNMESGEGVRTIMDGKKTVETIRQGSNEIRIENALRGYEWVLTKAEDE